MPTPPIEGRCDPRFERVREAFAANFEKHNELGASVAVLIDGRTVVDLWAGHRDEAKTEPWRKDTLVNVFSVGKGMASLSLLMLADHGLVDIDAPVARYWHEFAEGGKEAITIRQLLAHQAGLPAVREELPPNAIYDWALMTRALAAQTPWWTPGTKHGYHVNTFGFLVGEIVRRVDGRTIGRFFREEVAAPLGADFHIGLASEHHARVADFVWLPELAEIFVYDRSKLKDEQLMMLNTYFNPVGASGHGVVNDAAWRSAEYPSTNGHATALGIAQIYAVMAGRGEAQGRRFLGSDMLEQATREQSSGMDAILGVKSRFGLGFQLPSLEKPIGPNDGVILHFGAGGALGFADPVAGLSFGYAMNRMGPRFGNPTNRSLITALYESLAAG